MALPIIKLRWLWFTVSGLLVSASIIMLAAWGLRYGIDFTGGSLINVDFVGTRPDKTALEQKISPLNFNATVQPRGDNGYLLRTKDLTRAEYESLVAKMKEITPTNSTLVENSFETIGPAIGNELKQKSIKAIAAVLVAIMAYIAWAFRRVSQPVQSWKYGLAALLALFHDISIPVGVFVFLGHFHGTEINILFITALLAILGYSVNDTIVVFDRIRENLINSRHKEFEEVVNDSVNQTIARSINTSATLFVILVSMYFFGGESLKDFTLTLIIGVVTGTYSSIFIASPLLVWWHKLSLKN